MRNTPAYAGQTMVGNVRYRQTAADWAAGFATSTILKENTGANTHGTQPFALSICRATISARVDWRIRVLNLGTPARGLAFIKHISTVDRYPGSSIYLTDKSREAIAKQQFDVLRVGGFERCDEEECERWHKAEVEMRPTGADWTPDMPIGTVSALLHPHDVRTGDWVLCRLRSWGPTPQPDVFVVRVDDILGKFLVT